MDKYVDKHMDNIYVCSDRPLVNHPNCLESTYNPPLNDGAVLDTYKRYQSGLTVNNLFPIVDGKCSCGCGEKLAGRRRKWKSDKCRRKALYEFYVIKGDVEVIREFLFQSEEGFCRACGVLDKKWQADHIIPVFLGGGACSMNNFQTLCEDCHKEKSRIFNRIFNRIPNSHDVFASSLNFIPSGLNVFRAFNQGIRKDVIGKAIIRGRLLCPKNW